LPSNIEWILKIGAVIQNPQRHEPLTSGLKFNQNIKINFLVALLGCNPIISEMCYSKITFKTAEAVNANLLLFFNHHDESWC